MRIRCKHSCPCQPDMEANVRFSLADATQSRQLGHCAGMRLITPPIDVVGFRVTTVDYWVVGWVSHRKISPFESKRDWLPGRQRNCF